MFTTDAHCDTLYEIAVVGKPADKCCVTPERLRTGGVCLQTFAMFASLRSADPYAEARAMLAEYKRLPIPRLDGKLPDDPPTVPTAVLSSEGGEQFQGKIGRLAEFDDAARLRLIALTWNYANEIGTPAAVNACDGLTPFGFEFLKEMDRRGVCADVSHLNEAGFWNVIDRAEVPPVASHSDCRWLCEHPRNLKKEQVKALIDRKGFIGINFFSTFLQEDSSASIEDVLNHIDEICQMGGDEIVGFGSDFDGIDIWPEGLANPSDFPALIERLRGRGYSQAALEKIAGLNYWRVLKTADAMRRV